MLDALTAMQARMLDLIACERPDPAALASILPAPLDALVRAVQPRRVTCEVIDFADRGAKLWIDVLVDAAPPIERAAFTRAGWAVDVRARVTEFQRGRTLARVIDDPDESSLEWAERIDPIPAGHAHAAIAANPVLACFAALASPPASVDSWGVALVAGAPPRGLVKIRRDVERSDEPALRELGFGPREGDEDDEDDALWSTRDGARSIVWLGGTVYGYVGPVPLECLGGWG